MVDASTGDILPVALDRIGNDGVNVQQSAIAVGVGSAASLRWQNSSATQRNGRFVRVKSGGCTTDCAAADTYRIRAFDTTCAIPPIDNSGTQVTVLLLQNPADYTISGNVRFFRRDGRAAQRLGDDRARRPLRGSRRQGRGPRTGDRLQVRHADPPASVLSPGTPGARRSPSPPRRRPRARPRAPPCARSRP